MKSTRQLFVFMDFHILCNLISNTFSCFLMNEQMMLPSSFEDNIIAL